MSLPDAALSDLNLSFLHVVREALLRNRPAALGEFQIDGRVADLLRIATGGTGRLLAFAHEAWPGLKLTGLDLSQPYLAEARRVIGRTARVRLIEGAAERLPFDDNSLDLVFSSFLMHELPADVRVEVLREMARVARPEGLIVIVDSIQKGDHPDWDGLLDLFPHYFHEPYYAEYVNGSLAGWAGEAGLVETEAERAFLSRITVLRPQ